MALLQACQEPLAGKVERQTHFAIHTTEVLWFHWLQTHFLYLLGPGNLSEDTTADPLSPILKFCINLR